MCCPISSAPVGPIAEADALGAIMGLDLSEDRGEPAALYMACLCGLSYGIAEIVEASRRRV